MSEVASLYLVFTTINVIITFTLNRDFYDTSPYKKDSMNMVMLMYTDCHTISVSQIGTSYICAYSMKTRRIHTHCESVRTTYTPVREHTRARARSSGVDNPREIPFARTRIVWSIKSAFLSWSFLYSVLHMFPSIKIHHSFFWSLLILFTDPGVYTIIH